ncbi:RNA-binding protein MEX3B-like [Pyrus ussuriensis x Pyrus communis]|uniref:RNA-binding protein MEX3B-like n=1 Tax=Pyrus ussuriensis x Pyrus communis TaxID=2448454 RepID=A0A5N5HT47_9ROSA|nr:RNA-binding protein MEX3B-like [Pyrus ussuriensis x Pyrus communis]
MCSIIDGLTIHRKLQSINSQSSNLTTSITYDDDLVEWCITLTFLACLIAYIVILTLLVIVTFMVMKYINEYEETGLEDVGGSAETDPLQPAGKTMRSTYGTCEEWDIESGKCRSSSSNSNNAVITSSSEDLYDRKICAICYTEQRDCFLVPCGHCATCYVCAERIFYGENKTCPICRRFIRKVRRLFAA